MTDNHSAFAPSPSQIAPINNAARSQYPAALLSSTCNSCNQYHYHEKPSKSFLQLWERLAQRSTSPSSPKPVNASNSPSLLWLTFGHLRLSDNPSVITASIQSGCILPVVTLTHNQVCPLVLQALTELEHNLAKLNTVLIVRIVKDSLHHHVAALCEIADVIHPQQIIFNNDNFQQQLQHSHLHQSDLNFLNPLKQRFIRLKPHPNHRHYLSDSPCTFPPPPPAAQQIVSDYSSPSFNRFHCGETAARLKCSSLLKSYTRYTLNQILVQLQDELTIGSISEKRIVSEYESSRMTARTGGPSRNGRPLKRERQPSTFDPFFMAPSSFMSSSPAMAALSIAAYDVNGGDRRGVEWNDKTQTFELQEWEHTETERHMNPQERIQEFIRRRRQFLKRSFFPEDVTPDYYSFTAWRFAQRCVSSTIGVFGTSSLLFALGIRSGRIGQAAVISWVLKEGLGRVGKMIWAGSMGKDFDVDPKRWRFRSALLYALGNGLEIVTQIFPASFLVLATAANSMKQVSMLTSSATRNAMYRSFGERTQNIANITAKGEAQTVIADLIGMGCGIRLSRLLGGSRIHVIGVYGILTVLDIFGIYMELRSVVFRSLNAERSSIIVNRALKDGLFLTPSQVSPKESIFLKQKYKSFVRLSSIAKAAQTPKELDMLLRVFKRERFLVATPSSTGSTTPSGPCRLVLRKDASNEDVLRAMLVVGHLQRELRNHGKKPLSTEESERMLRNARTLTKRSMSWFVSGLKENGWNTDNLLFSTMKRRGYWGL